MFQGEVVSIHICANAGDPMQSPDSVLAVEGKGLEGDRYWSGVGTYSDKGGPQRQVTFIEEESIAAIAHERGVVIEPREARRNIVTRGVPLNHLVGQRFQVGDAVFQGIMVCEPCNYLQQITVKGVLSGLIHRGGLNAEVVQTAVIRIGDAVAVSAPVAAATTA
jgi:MOSC domain-containing protein YiiM